MVAIFLAVAFKAFAICGIGMKISAFEVYNLHFWEDFPRLFLLQQ